MTDGERLLRLREVADWLGVSHSTMYHWRGAGKGPPGFLVGGQVRYRAGDVQAWLNQQQAAVGEAGR